MKFIVRSCSLLLLFVSMLGHLSSWKNPAAAFVVGAKNLVDDDTTVVPNEAMDVDTAGLGESDVPPPPPHKIYPVSITSVCAGASLHHVDPNEQNFTAKALEETFFKVHAAHDGSQIVGVVVTRSFFFQDNSRREDTRVTQDVGEGFLRGSWVNQEDTSYEFGSNYIGGYGCDRCLEEENHFRQEGKLRASLGTPLHEKWESEFLSQLQQGPFPELGNLTHCDITMIATTSSVKEE